MDVFVEEGKPDKERDANQVLDPFDILVVVNQREHFLDLANRIEEICHFLTLRV
jgi:hypothetical protein